MSLVGELGRERFLHDALEPVVDDYDEVVIDTPPNLGLLTVNALVCSGCVLAPVSAEDEGAVHGILELRGTISKLAKRLGGEAPRLIALVTRWSPTRISSRTVEDRLTEAGSLRPDGSGCVGADRRGGRRPRAGRKPRAGRLIAYRDSAIAAVSAPGRVLYSLTVRLAFNTLPGTERPLRPRPGRPVSASGRASLDEHELTKPLRLVLKGVLYHSGRSPCGARTAFSAGVAYSSHVPQLIDDHLNATRA